MATKVTPAQSVKKNTTAPVTKAPAKKTDVKETTEVKETKTTKTQSPKEVVEKKPVPKPKKQADLSKMETPAPKKAQKEEKKAAPKVDTNPAKIQTSKPQTAKTTSTGKTCYHVSKRDNDGREWKVFIQGSDKVIKLFDTQEEALKYAQTLAKNKDDGSYVLLHSLTGKIRKY